MDLETIVNLEFTDIDSKDAWPLTYQVNYS